MAKQKEETLPKTVFVYREHDGDETYLVAVEKRAAFVDNTVRLVGTYRLVEVGEQVQVPRYKRKRFAG